MRYIFCAGINFECVIITTGLLIVWSAGLRQPAKNRLRIRQCKPLSYYALTLRTYYGSRGFGKTHI